MPAYNDIIRLYRKIINVIENNTVSTKYTSFDYDSNSTYEIEIQNENNSQIMILKVISMECCVFTFTVLKNRSIGVSNHISLIKDSPEFISIYSSKVNGTVNCNKTELPLLVRDEDLFQYSTLISNEEFEGYKFYLKLDIDKYDFIIYISSVINYNIFHVMLEGNNARLE